MLRAFYACVLVLVLASPGLGQTTAAGSVRGVVTDAQGGVLPGVVVTARSPSAPGVHQAVTDGSGRYRLGDLPPGEYAVAAELTGFSRFERSPIAMRAGLNVDVDIVMQVGGIDETVRVVQEAPLLDTARATQTVNVSGELLRSMPLSEKREWFGAVMLAPGVTSAIYTGQQRFFVHGADANANAIQIDGADVSSTATGALHYVAMNADAVDDIQIKTAGIDASAPLGVGGVINIALASGTNQARGAAGLFVQPKRWNDSNLPGGTTSAVEQTMLDLSGGAPLVRDRLWAFGAYRFTDAETGISRTPEQLTALEGLIPGYEPYGNVNRSHFWLAKLTSQLGPSHQVSGFYQEDTNPTRTREARGDHPRIEVFGGTAVSARWLAAWSDRLTTRAGVSFNDKRRQIRDPEVDGPAYVAYDSVAASGARLVGVGRLAAYGAPSQAWSDELNSKLTLSLDTTWLAEGVGSHEVQFGVYVQPRLRTGLVFFWVNEGFVGEDVFLTTPGDYSHVTPFHRRYMDGDVNTAAALNGSDTAFYVQDAWRPLSRLTISAGLRVDRIQWEDAQYDLPGVDTVAVGPRLGVNYALSETGRQVVRAHWVRVHSRAGVAAVLSSTTSLASRDAYDLDFDGTFETVFATPAVLGGSPTRLMDPDLEQPSVREWGLGYDHQAPGGVTLGVDFLHREFLDRLSYLETNGVFEGRRFVGYADERYSDVLQITNNRWNTPVYRSLELSVTKRSARLQGMASYVRQWRHINGTWQPHDPASFIQPGAFPNDRGIGAPTDLDTSTLSANGLSGYTMTQPIGASAQWQDHTVRVGVSGVGPWGLLVAANYTFQSGSWSGPIYTLAEAADPTFGPPTVTLSNGRVVPNPLATTIRFAHATRGEGQLKTPALHAVNVRLGKRVPLGGADLELALDVFNVTNHGADEGFEIGATQTFSPAYGLTVFRQLPRSAQLMARVSF